MRDFVCYCEKWVCSICKHSEGVYHLGCKGQEYITHGCPRCADGVNQ